MNNLEVKHVFALAWHRKHAASKSLSSQLFSCSGIKRSIIQEEAEAIWKSCMGAFHQRLRQDTCLLINAEITRHWTGHL